jgi:hypothetical protein
MKREQKKSVPLFYIASSNNPEPQDKRRLEQHISTQKHRAKARIEAEFPTIHLAV